MGLVHFAITAAFAVTVCACSSTYVVRCRDGDHLAIHDSLCFGTAKPGGVVSPEVLLPRARQDSGSASTVKSFEKMLTCSSCFIPTTQLMRKPFEKWSKHTRPNLSKRRYCAYVRTRARRFNSPL